MWKWYFVTKIVLTCFEKKSSDWEKLLKFEAEGQEFAKILSSLEQFLFMFAYLGPIMFPPLGMST